MITVVDTNSSVSAITQDCLISTAANIIQEDGTSSRTKDPITNIDCYCICCKNSKLLTEYYMKLQANIIQEGPVPELKMTVLFAFVIAMASANHTTKMQQSDQHHTC